MPRLAALLATLLLLPACGLPAGSAGDPADGGSAGAAPVETASPAEDPGGDPGDEPRAGEATEEHPEAEPAPPGSGLTVVSTVFPLAWLAVQVAPGAQHVHLAARGQDPHDLELSPGDRTLLETADVVAYMGDLDFQPQVEAAVGQRDGVTVGVDAVVGEGALREFGEHDDAGDHDDDDGHGHDDEAQDDDHAHGEYDPHVWFDAALMAEVAVALGEAFAQVDPPAAQAYRDRAQAVDDELVALAAELDGLLAGCRHETVIVSHEAYAYLLEPKGLHQEGISGAGGHGEASPQRLADLTRRIQDQGIPAVLAEPVEGRADAEALAREAGVDLLEVDPLEVAGEEAMAAGYPALLRQQAERFAEALDCSGEE